MPRLDSEVTKNNTIIAALLHDLCKCDIYKKNTKMKREYLGIREETTSYIVSYTDFPMGHGEKSEILLVTILQTADTLAARIIGSLLGIALTKDVISMRISL